MEQQHLIPLPKRSASSKSVFELETDALTHCVRYLSLSDLSNFARTCKHFKSIAYSDYVWRHLFRKQWPQLESSIISGASGGMRAAYLDRHLAVQKFAFQEDVLGKQWHNGPVTAISDKLLGESSSSSGNLIASGEHDGTVCLWSLSSNIKQGQRALRTMFHGHERAIESLSVSGYNTSLLVSLSKDCKIKVWDTAASSSACSSRCVGKLSFGKSLPLGIKCFESLCYVAAGTSITAIDLRTMRKVFCANARESLHSYEVLPAKSLVGTGGYGKAMLWDVRRSGAKPEPVIEMEEHSGPVSSLHMDSYKIVTGSVKDSYCNVWDTNSGKLVNSLRAGIPHVPDILFGCSAMAVSGSRIVTTTCNDERGLVYLRDFNNATCPKPSKEDNQCTSKF
ncbi:hypothetical protein Sjap_015803 [Stephania japonica]|uniref:F-box domain-containing protein n=1 Tax=Stephania japonica TaxID=461633 RepID=A0AAP0IJT4_9MAGN